MTDLLTKQLETPVKDGPEKDDFFKDFEGLVPPGEYAFSQPDEPLDVDFEDTTTTDADIRAVLSPGAAPEIGELADDEVALPGGYITKDGALYRTAVVRELTGEDEEALARARANTVNTVRFTRTLLHAVESIGPEKYTDDLGKGLLLGDREALILGIRLATFGKDITFENFVCPGCAQQLDITLDLSTIETKVLDNPEQREFEIPTSRGDIILVRLPTVADADAVLEQANATEAERNTLMLSRCVLAINGHKTNGSKDAVKKLNLGVRQDVIKFLAETQPGPLYDEVKSKHEVCETEFPLFLSVDDMFRGL